LPGTFEQGTGFLEDRGFSIAAVHWELGQGAEPPRFIDRDGNIRYVEGAGLAIVRDATDFLAHAAADSSGTPNPLKGAISRTLAAGKSQSGVVLRTFLFHGYNIAEGRRVFDGMHVFVSWAGVLPKLQSGTGPTSSTNDFPTYDDPDFRGAIENPLTIGDLIKVVEDRGGGPSTHRFDQYNDRLFGWACLAIAYRRRRPVRIVRYLEANRIPTCSGKIRWDNDRVKTMLKNETYAGIRYFNRMTRVKKGDREGKALIRGQWVYREPSEWIAVTVPAIVSREVFDKVQEQLREHDARYCQPATHYLLSGLVQCGVCGSGCSSFRRWQKVVRPSGTVSVYHHAAYGCNRRARENSHDERRLNAATIPQSPRISLRATSST
jgi:Recombinase/Alpha/beta hydrolase domain